MDDYGQRALFALRDWNGRQDSTLPHSMADHLYGMAAAFPPTRLSGSAASQGLVVPRVGVPRLSDSPPHKWIKRSFKAG